MKLKRILAVMLTLAMVLACSACSGKPETAAEVAAKMQAALDETPPTQYSVDFVLDASLSLGSYGSMDFSVTNKSDVTVSNDPYGSHSVINTEISYGEGIEPTASSIETYSVFEGDEVVSYASSDAGSTWNRSTLGITKEDLTDISDLVLFDEENVAIDSTVTEYNGEKVVCLTSTVSGTEIQEAIAAAMEETGTALDGIDLSPLSCDTVVYVNAATYLPIAEVFNISGASDVLTTLVASAIGDGLTVDVSSCVLTLSFASYDAQGEITVPQDVLDNATELSTAIDDVLSTEEEEISEEVEAVEETAEAAEEAVKDESAAQ